MLSNHGGRQFDHSVTRFEVLDHVVQSHRDQLEIILDGGIRRGTDILKALALGARAVSYARPYLYGLAAGGERGVRKALSIMENSILRDMALMGLRNIGD